MSLSRYFGIRDILLLLALAMMIISLFASQWVFQLKKGSTIVVTVDEDEYGCYSLKEDQTIPIMIGDTEENTLQIHDGVATMIYATCPDKLCVHQGAISRTGQSIVCLPHRVVVLVLEGDENPIDSMAK